MIATPPAGPAAAGIDLDQVHTTADASAWLHGRSAAYLAAADGEPSPMRARALQLASSTLQVYATVVGTYRNPTGIGAELGRLAEDYRHPDRDAVEPIPEVHRVTCGHLAEVLGPLAQRLTHLNPAGLQQGSGHTRPARARPSRCDVPVGTGELSTDRQPTR